MKAIKIIGAVGATVALLGTASTQIAQAAAPACSALDDPIYQVVNPKVGSSLLTPWAGEATKAKAKGFSEQRGEVFFGSTTPAPGLVGVHRLYNGATQDFLFSTSASEVKGAVARKGYTDQGVSFYVSPRANKAGGCGDAATRLVRGTQHRVAATSDERSQMVAAGWRAEGVQLYVARRGQSTPTTPATETGRFQFAVVPDTQLEVLKSNDVRLKARNEWLVQKKVAFVTQTGDLVNWDTENHEQYSRAKSGMNVLTANQTPYTVAVGNHDTAATGVGGSARAGKSWELVRDTTTLNDYFSASDFGNVGGAFEKGKIDNVFATYQAGGKNFLVLTLEFNARKEAVAWAREVVASHPDHNVIISTHSYLTGRATISTSNDGYGATNPKYVFDNLVSRYPNIKMVFSGHVGVAAKARVDRGVKGNKVYSFLTTFHEGRTNPVRMLTVDTAKGTISSTIYAPLTGTTWKAYDQTITGVDFV